MGMEATEAFVHWYTDEHPRLVSALACVSGDVDLAQDAADEAFARALERWPAVSAMASPGAWTYRVALNVLRRRARRSTLERRLLGPQKIPTQPPPEVADPAVWRAVRGLPPRQRTAVVLRYVADLTEREIARVMGTAPGTVAATLHTARKRLAAALDTPLAPAGDPT